MLVTRAELALRQNGPNGLQTATSATTTQQVAFAQRAPHARPARSRTHTVHTRTSPTSGSPLVNSFTESFTDAYFTAPTVCVGKSMPGPTLRPPLNRMCTDEINIVL